MVTESRLVSKYEMFRITTYKGLIEQQTFVCLLYIVDTGSPAEPP